MEVMKEFVKIDFSYVLFSVFLILIGIKAVVSVMEWIVHKLGLETKWMRKQREEHELLIRTSRSLAALQERHSESLQIQKEITDSIQRLADRNSVKDMQIDHLMIAQREVLADKINDKYKYYISIQGIPEDEVDEFANLHSAYKGVGGNHSGDTKFEYCMNHLPVIPVETKLIRTEE